MKNKKSCKQEIVDALRKKRTFDLDHDANGYPTIHWLIGKWILRNHTQFAQDDCLHHGRLRAIQINLESAIKELEEKQKIPVYKGPANSKRVVYLTLDADYRDAKEQDYLRTMQQATNKIEATKRKVAFKNPNCLPGLCKRILSLPELSKVI